MLIGILSDAHGNGAAFDRAVALLTEKGAEHLYFLGDAIGYVPSVTVLESLERLGDFVECIRGNHESLLLKGKCNPVRELVYQFETLRPKLTTRQINIFKSWPVSRKITIDGSSILLVHGSPTDETYGYVYPDTDLSGFTPGADLVFMGNTHRPFIREHAGICYVNVGSCAMPRDDGRYGSVALLDTKTTNVRILRFDIVAESQRVVEQYPMLHPSVRSIYERRSRAIVGEIL